MLNNISDTQLQHNLSIKYYENNFNYFDRYKPQENHKFGRGHIIRQYMSGVGVITERYISDDHLLYSKSENHPDQSTSNIDAKSFDYLMGEQEEGKEETIITTIPVNCPCYKKACEEELKKNRLFKNIFLSVFQTFKSEITKLLRLNNDVLYRYK